jgi:hypothetical protein
MHRTFAAVTPSFRPCTGSLDDIATASMRSRVVATRIRRGAYYHAATENDGEETGDASVISHFEISQLIVV